MGRVKTMSDAEVMRGVVKPVEGEYGVIAEKNSITGKLQWSVGKWIRDNTKDHRPDLVSVGVDKVEVRSGGEVIDLYRKDLHPNRLLYKSYDDALFKARARNEAIESKKVFEAWVRKTEI